MGHVRRLTTACLLALCLAPPLVISMPAHANSQLALAKGCYSCHGEPPRRGAPTVAQLADSYARYRNEPGAVARLAGKLRAGGLFSHIAAHERLNRDECETLVRWLIDGAK